MTTDEFEAIPEDEWKALATTEITHLTDEEKDYLPRAWDEWIARVRRDSAREFVDRTLLDWGIGEDEDSDLGSATADDLRAAVDDVYPEETP